jgi:hypothetical protein
MSEGEPFPDTERGAYLFEVAHHAVQGVVAACRAAGPADAALVEIDHLDVPLEQIS